MEEKLFCWFRSVVSIFVMVLFKLCTSRRIVVVSDSIPCCRCSRFDWRDTNFCSSSCSLDVLKECWTDGGTSEEVVRELFRLC